MSTKPRSAPRGRSPSTVEVNNISANGLWLLLDEGEHFLPYEKFPWFREARIADILKVERPSAHHLYWPELDVDLAVESIRHPDRYPLISRDRPGTGRRRTSSRATVAGKQPPRRSTRH